MAFNAYQWHKRCVFYAVALGLVFSALLCVSESAWLCGDGTVTEVLAECGAYPAGHPLAAVEYQAAAPLGAKPKPVKPEPPDEPPLGGEGRSSRKTDSKELPKAPRLSKPPKRHSEDDEEEEEESSRFGHSDPTAREMDDFDEVLQRAFIELPMNPKRCVIKEEVGKAVLTLGVSALSECSIRNLRAFVVANDVDSPKLQRLLASLSTQRAALVELQKGFDDVPTVELSNLHSLARKTMAESGGTFESLSTKEHVGEVFALLHVFIKCESLLGEIEEVIEENRGHTLSDFEFEFEEDEEQDKTKSDKGSTTMSICGDVCELHPSIRQNCLEMCGKDVADADPDELSRLMRPYEKCQKYGVDRKDASSWARCVRARRSEPQPAQAGVMLFVMSAWSKTKRMLNTNPVTHFREVYRGRFGGATSKCFSDVALVGLPVEKYPAEGTGGSYDFRSIHCCDAAGNPAGTGNFVMVNGRVEEVTAPVFTVSDAKLYLPDGTQRSANHWPIFQDAKKDFKTPFQTALVLDGRGSPFGHAAYFDDKEHGDLVITAAHVWKKAAFVVLPDRVIDANLLSPVILKGDYAVVSQNGGGNSALYDPKIFSRELEAVKYLANGGNLVCSFISYVEAGGIRKDVKVFYDLSKGRLSGQLTEGHIQAGDSGSVCRSEGGPGKPRVALVVSGFERGPRVVFA